MLKKRKFLESILKNENQKSDLVIWDLRRFRPLLCSDHYV